MRSVVFGRYGDPATELRLSEAPVPEPREGQVRVRLRARPVNPSDLLFVQGRYGRPADFSPAGRLPDAPPCAPVGFEGAGEVDRAGPGTRLRPGTRVAVAAAGTWSEYLTVAEDEVLPVPPDLPWETACQLTVNPFTAHLLLRDLALEPGESLLLTGASSALGRMLTRLAGERGIRCVCVVRHPVHTGPLLAAGAEQVVVGTDGGSVGSRLEAVGEDRTVAAVLDAVGGGVGRAALSALRDGGRFVVYGLLSGQPLPVPLEDLVFRDVVIRGFWLPERLRSLDPGTVDRLTRRVVEDVRRGLLTAPVAARYDLAEVTEAVAHHMRPRRTGRIVLTG
ncbi:zinc-dependent alcohol dehydrogenase family protein [Streptomyces qinglanensis]|uniref:zinc-dependent alcohol dehydrogenase family protein n=1 Tax=Streptomyces qinglanensis TaxID=943816 RepID=UPI0037A05B13